MDLKDLLALSIAVAVIAAGTGNWEKLQMWVWKAQAQVIYESRTSNWGSHDFFQNGNLCTFKRLVEWTKILALIRSRIIISAFARKIKPSEKFAGLIQWLCFCLGCCAKCDSE